MWKRYRHLLHIINVRGTSRANVRYNSRINRLRYATEWSPEGDYSQLSRSLSPTARRWCSWRIVV